MKIYIEIVGDIEEDEVHIRCREITDSIQKIQQSIQEASFAPKLTFLKKNEEYYFPLETVLFFETENDNVYAHTADDVYRIKLRLYELDNILPRSFVRVSKSAILNTVHIYSISRSLTSASLVQFQKSHKQIFVSRMYYKNLRQRLDEKFGKPV